MRTSSSACNRGRHQNGAVLRVRLRPPSHIQNVNKIMAESDGEDTTEQFGKSYVC